LANCAGNAQVIAAATLGDVVRHFTGQSPIQPSKPREVTQTYNNKDLVDFTGQERAKRALEIAAAGRHHLMMVGAPDSRKSMLAARGYHRVPRVARTIADLDGFEDIKKTHITEAINFRLPTQLDG
jgi:predicted ATPase with chaperone activity